MAQSRTRNILDICDEAMALDAAARDAYLRNVCGDDVRLRESVESVMRAVTAAGNFLETPDQPVASPKDLIGSHIGHYRIVEKLGEGGMGAVYLAERLEDDFTHRVAIKLVRGHLLIRELFERFEAERKILAKLNHPYIAALIDGGTTADGVPYLVMEYVEGVAADIYCDTHKLDLAARIQLIRKVAMAVQSAHQNLVVHRDLKPSNVLVTADGIPKLLDFGIAKLIQLDESVHGSTTILGRQAMTPDYASPEQILENTVTTASDVYTLGILTYQLLAGQRPYHIDTMSHVHMLKTVEELTIPHASARLDSLASKEAVEAIAAKRSTTSARLKKMLSGDLDNILMKALDRNPLRRYASVAEFSADLGRYLKGMPVDARPDSVAYRLQLFVARNKAGVLAAGMLLITIVSALALTSWAYLRAESARAESAQRFTEVREMANTMMFDVYDEVSKLSGATSARKILASRAQTYLDSLTASDHASPDIWLDAGRGYARLAEVLGGVDDLTLGDRELAADNYKKAETFLTRIHTAYPNNIEYTVALARLQSTLAAHALYSDNDIPRSRQHAQKSLDLFTAVTPQSDTTIVGRVDAMVELADTYDWEGDQLSGQKILKEALTLIENVDTNPATNFVAAAAKARAVRDYGAALYWSDDMEGSERYLQESVELYRQLLIHSEAKPTAERSLAIALFNLAGTQSDNEHTEQALVTIDEAMRIAKKLIAADAGNVGAQTLMSSVADQRGLILSDLGRHDEAIAQALETYALQKAANANISEDAMAYRELTVHMHSVAQAYIKAQRNTLACTWIEQVADRFAQMQARNQLTGYDEKTQLPLLVSQRKAVCPP